MVLFYATPNGQVYEDYTPDAIGGKKAQGHAGMDARERLAEKLAARRKQTEAKSKPPPVAQQPPPKLTAGRASSPRAAQESEEAGAKEEVAPAQRVWPEENSSIASDVQQPVEEGAATNADMQAARRVKTLEMRRIGNRLRGMNLGLALGVGTPQGIALARERKCKSFMSRAFARASKKESSSKALPAQYYHRQDAADNADRRAIVHHTASHYVMAGGGQYNRGLRLKGVVLRHSKQGAKLQQARNAKRAGMDAREDARGERGGQGGGRKQGKSIAKKGGNKRNGTASNTGN
ncbi:hypothetical protein T484DRAFT_1948690 [Baffinella frigidus]|nr:hypothetical protein T484DRAFT_1948690 [Cryptophyta sp. CCMP2293]